MIFDINFPTAVLMGEDSSSKTGEKLKELGVTKTLVIYDQGIKSVGVVDKIVNNIKAAGIGVVEYGGVLSDPPDTIVNEAGELGRKEKVDAVVGIGGGSCLDTAKATRVLLANPGTINQYFGFSQQNISKEPLVLIPTTSGTGSEISIVAAITDTATGLKLGPAGPNCVATLAIVDPLLTVALPPKVTAMTGVDTLTHAIEAYTCSIATPMVDIIALEAITLVGKSLKTAVQDGSNVQARADMSFACTLAGMAFTPANLQLGHSIGAPLGARFHLAHGLAVAVILAPSIEFIYDAQPEKLRNIGKAMNFGIDPNLSNLEYGKALAQAFRQYNKELGIPTLKELTGEMSEEDIAALTIDTMGMHPLIDVTPRNVTAEDVTELIKKELAL